MDAARHHQVIEAVINRTPTYNFVLYQALLNCPRLSRFFPTRAELVTFVQSQILPTMEATRVYTVECFDHPDAEPRVGETPAVVGEAWVFASCWAFHVARPANPLQFAHFYGVVSSRYLAVAVLQDLRQPLFLDPRADFYNDAGFWRPNLVFVPAVFGLLSVTLRDDVELAGLAIAGCTETFKFAGPTVRANRVLAMRAVEIDGMLLAYCSMELRADVGLVACACRQNRGAAQFISGTLLRDRESLMRLRGQFQVGMGDLAGDALMDPAVVASCFICSMYDKDHLSDQMASAVEWAIAYCHNARTYRPVGDGEEPLTQAIYLRCGERDVEITDFYPIDPIVFGGQESADALALLQHEQRQHRRGQDQPRRGQDQPRRGRGQPRRGRGQPRRGQRHPRRV